MKITFILCSEPVEIFHMSAVTLYLRTWVLLYMPFHMIYWLKRETENFQISSKAQKSQNVTSVFMNTEKNCCGCLSTYILDNQFTYMAILLC